MSEVVGPATLSVTQAIGAFNVFLPRFTDVRRNNPADNPEFAGDVRTGEVAACVVSLGVGATISSLTKSPVPVLAAAFISLVLVILYESVLQSHKPFEVRNPLTLESEDA